MAQTLIDTAINPNSSTKRKYNEVNPDEEEPSGGPLPSVEQTKSAIFDAFTTLLQEAIAAQSVPSLVDEVTHPVHASRGPMLAFNPSQNQLASKLPGHPLASPSLVHLNVLSTADSRRQLDHSLHRETSASSSSPQ
jgi:hypothetical protein